ncbi:MAG: ATP cone domain-containing protein, partial [Aquihabitans sp.]
CIGCQRRFTTFERLEEVPLLVVKRSGDRDPFDRAKVIAGLVSATKSRPVAPEQLEDLTTAVEESLRLEGSEVPSHEVGRTVLERLRDLDIVAAVRFASVYKEFDDIADFERELTELTHSAAFTKATEPKRR